MARRLASCAPARRRKSPPSVAFADQNGLKIVPQGGNTGLVGGQTPDARPGDPAFAAAGSTGIREIDPDSNTMIVEAGMTLQS